MEFSLRALGQVIREHRVAIPLTQDELGNKARYRAGAGVSISRIEHGLTRPGRERFDGIALALGLTPAQLESAAEKRTRDIEAQGDGLADSADGRKRSVDRKQVGQELERRETVGNELCEAFNDAHDRARDAFLLTFQEIANGIGGAPPPNPKKLKDDDATGAESEAALRLRLTSSGVEHALASGTPSATALVAAGAVGPAAGRAAAYATFRTVVARGVASTGAPTSDLFGIAQTNAAFAIMGGGTRANGGAGVAGGRRRLKFVELGADLAAQFTVAVVASAYNFRKQQQELAAKLDAEIRATRRGFEAVEDFLPRATKVLDEIAVHGGRALSKWDAQIGPRPLEWGSLDPTQQERYQDFVKITACQLAVATINFPELVESRGKDREALIEFADTLLNQSQELVGSLV